MPEFITIGETMGAFSPGEAVPLRYEDRYSVRIAGAESNTAISGVGLSGRWHWQQLDSVGQMGRGRRECRGNDTDT